MNIHAPDDQGIVTVNREWVLPKKLRQGIREALAGKHGMLRMDAEDLAELIGKAIDLELDRLRRIRRERAQSRNLLERGRREAELFFKPIGRSPVPTESDCAPVSALFKGDA